MENTDGTADALFGCAAFQAWPLRKSFQFLPWMVVDRKSHFSTTAGRRPHSLMIHVTLQKAT